MSKGNLFVISGPSGSGKDTIIAAVIDELKQDAFLSISMTTRAMRPGDIDGKDYYFVSNEEFEKNIEENQMLEYAKYGSNYYGTPIAPIKKLTNEGKVVILNIEVQGARYVKTIMPDVVKIFIVPPSLEVLEQRLRGRGTENEEAIAKRMAIAATELESINEYDYVVENDLIDDAVNDILAIIRANQLRIDNNKINL